MNGKVIGVLCSYGLSHGAGLPNFRSISNYLRDFNQVFADKGWTVVVFSVEDILKHKNILWGWSRSEAVWRRIFTPIPKICLIRRSSLDKKEQEVLRWMEEDCGTKFINHPNLIEILNDRWRTNQILVSHPNLVSKTPDCFPLIDSKKILEIKEKSSSFIIRPRSTSTIQKYIIGTFVKEGIKCQFYYKKKLKTIVFKNVDSAIKAAKENIGLAIVEAHKVLFENEGHTIAFRCIFIKTDQWHHQATLLRVGRKKVFFGPFATVGEVQSYQKVLESLFGSSANSVLFQALNTSKNIVELLDARTQDGARELSVDILFSKDLEPIVFDVSSQGAIFSINKIGNPEFKGRILATLEQSANKILEHESTGILRS